jgi:hypothetical protein
MNQSKSLLSIILDNKLFFVVCPAQNELLASARKMSRIVKRKLAYLQKKAGFTEGDFKVKIETLMSCFMMQIDY